jgi:CcmD family protein
MTVDTYPDLFWAYTAVWAILAIYIASLGARLKRIERSIGSCGASHRDVVGCCDSKR